MSKEEKFMATLNDYKLVKNISKKYFDRLEVELDIDDNQKSRLGFYPFILSCITEITDIDTLKELIIDTEFRKKVFKQGNNDLGIDAYFIDEDNKRIFLFNFKYRTKKFNPDSSQEINMLNDSSKFINAIYTENTQNTDTTTGEVIQKIIEKQNSTDLWEITLFLVSNENNKLDINKNEVVSFAKQYDIEIVPISLDEIVEYISDSPDDKKATFVTDSDAVLTYKVNNFSSSQSYLVKIPLITLLRITCDSDQLKEQYSLEDYDVLETKKLDVSLLYDNVRGYLGETKFNKNIIQTLEENPDRFFMFNNGITITTKRIDADEIYGGKKFKCALDGFQIVNGGQTLRTIYKFKDDNFDVEKLASSEVLVRIFQTAEDYELTNDIAEYTNSQNAISSVDLKSISNIQIKIEEYFKSKDIDYIRKIDKSKAKSSRSITMEKMAQIIYSKMGYPDRVTSQKNNLFTIYYDQIFNNNLVFDELIELFELYSSIVSIYKKTDYDFSSQKTFYIVWIVSEKRLAIEESINIFEETLKLYKTDEALSDARKIIQKGFKDYLEERLKISKEMNSSKKPNMNDEPLTINADGVTQVDLPEYRYNASETVADYYNRVFKMFRETVPYLEGRLKGKPGRLSWSQNVTWNNKVTIPITNTKNATLNTGISEEEAEKLVKLLLEEIGLIKFE